MSVDVLRLLGQIGRREPLGRRRLDALIRPARWVPMKDVAGEYPATVVSGIETVPLHVGPVVIYLDVVEWTRRGILLEQWGVGVGGGDDGEAL